MGTLRYGFERRLDGATFDRAVEWVTPALKTEGFGVLTGIDVRDTLKKNRVITAAGEWETAGNSGAAARATSTQRKGK